MSLNIKSERVHALAREAARVTGKSQTGAVEEALTRLLRDYDRDPERAGLAERVDRVREIVSAYAAAPEPGASPVRDVEDLYDEDGLPR